jgi:hypothetical protein
MRIHRSSRLQQYASLVQESSRILLFSECVIGDVYVCLGFVRYRWTFGCGAFFPAAPLHSIPVSLNWILRFRLTRRKVSNRISFNRKDKLAGAKTVVTFWFLSSTMQFAQLFHDDAVSNGTTVGKEGRAFLESNLKLLVTQAMKLVLEEQPRDPLAFIARYLKKHNPKRNEILGPSLEDQITIPIPNTDSSVHLQRLTGLMPGTASVHTGKDGFSVYGLLNPCLADLKSIATELKIQGKRTVKFLYMSAPRRQLLFLNGVPYSADLTTVQAPRGATCSSPHNANSEFSGGEESNNSLNDSVTPFDPYLALIAALPLELVPAKIDPVLKGLQSTVGVTTAELKVSEDSGLLDVTAFDAIDTAVGLSDDSELSAIVILSFLTPDSLRNAMVAVAAAQAPLVELRNSKKAEEEQRLHVQSIKGTLHVTHYWREVRLRRELRDRTRETKEDAAAKARKAGVLTPTPPAAANPNPPPADSKDTPLAVADMTTIQSTNSLNGTVNNAATLAQLEKRQNAIVARQSRRRLEDMVAGNLLSAEQNHAATTIQALVRGHLVRVSIQHRIMEATSGLHIKTKVPAAPRRPDGKPSSPAIPSGIGRAAATKATTNPQQQQQQLNGSGDQQRSQQQKGNAANREFYTGFAMMRRTMFNLCEQHEALITTRPPSQPLPPKQKIVWIPKRSRIAPSYPEDVSSEDEQWESVTKVVPRRRPSGRTRTFNPQSRMDVCYGAVCAKRLQQYPVEVAERYKGVSALQRRAYSHIHQQCLHVLHAAFVELRHRQELKLASFAAFVQNRHWEVLSWLTHPHQQSLAIAPRGPPSLLVYGPVDILQDRVVVGLDSLMEREGFTLPLQKVHPPTQASQAQQIPRSGNATPNQQHLGEVNSAQVPTSIGRTSSTSAAVSANPSSGEVGTATPSKLGFTPPPISLQIPPPSITPTLGGINLDALLGNHNIAKILRDAPVYCVPEGLEVDKWKEATTLLAGEHSHITWVSLEESPVVYIGKKSYTATFRPETDEFPQLRRYNDVLSSAEIIKTATVGKPDPPPIAAAAAADRKSLSGPQGPTAGKRGSQSNNTGSTAGSGAPATGPASVAVNLLPALSGSALSAPSIQVSVQEHSPVGSPTAISPRRAEVHWFGTAWLEMERRLRGELIRQAENTHGSLRLYRWSSKDGHYITDDNSLFGPSSGGTRSSGSGAPAGAGSEGNRGDGTGNADSGEAKDRRSLASVASLKLEAGKAQSLLRRTTQRSARGGAMRAESSSVQQSPAIGNVQPEVRESFNSQPGSGASIAGAGSPGTFLQMLESDALEQLIRTPKMVADESVFGPGLHGSEALYLREPALHVPGDPWLAHLERFLEKCLRALVGNGRGTKEHPACIVLAVSGPQQLFYAAVASIFFAKALKVPLKDVPRAPPAAAKTGASGISSPLSRPRASGNPISGVGQTNVTSTHPNELDTPTEQPLGGPEPTHTFNDASRSMFSRVWNEAQNMEIPKVEETSTADPAHKTVIDHAKELLLTLDSTSGQLVFDEVEWLAKQSAELAMFRSLAETYLNDAIHEDDVDPKTTSVMNAARAAEEYLWFAIVALFLKQQVEPILNPGSGSAQQVDLANINLPSLSKFVHSKETLIHRALETIPLICRNAHNSSGSSEKQQGSSHSLDTTHDHDAEFDGPIHFPTPSLTQRWRERHFVQTVV